MVEFMKDIGIKIICTDKVYINGQMADNTKETMLMTKKMATVCIRTQMAVAIKASGKTENNMVKDYLLVLKEYQEKVNGKMVRECFG